MGRDHLFYEARARSYQDRRTCYPWHCLPCQQGRLKRKGRPVRHLRRTFSTFGFFLFLPSITPAPPWSIKGRAGQPTKGTDRFHTQHTAKQQPSSWRPFDIFVRDLGHISLLTVYTPYYEPFLVLITRAAANWTYGRSARTSINLVSFSTPSEHNAQQI